jgi:NADPH:quinone reductase-like Zn-dependent oxidoreductase
MSTACLRTTRLKEHGQTGSAAQQAGGSHADEGARRIWKDPPVIDREYPLDDAAEAISYVGEGRARGKVIIKVL